MNNLTDHEKKKEMDDKGQFQPNKREQITLRNGVEYEINQKQWFKPGKKTRLMVDAHR